MAQIAGILLILVFSASARERPRPAKPLNEVAVTLEARVPGLATEMVNFGVPLPPRFLRDARMVRVLDSRGSEIEAAVRSLEPWRIDGKPGTIRSVQIQFRADFRNAQTQRVTVAFGKARTRNAERFVPVIETLIAADGRKGPRVLAVLPAKWLCDSWVAGPQVPAADSGEQAYYDRFVEKNFPGSLAYIASPVFDHWLFDRTTCWYKMYVRTGERKYLEAAYEAAHFVRINTQPDGPNAGMFLLKKGGPDLKYVYPRAMHLHYLLTGEERARDLGKIMAKLILDNWDPVYNRGFWTPRHEGYGFLGVLHGWEMTGETRYWQQTARYAAALHDHQTQPPDGRPGDGSFRQNWEQYDPREAKFKGATSAWMMAILLDPLFQYWMLTGDARIPEIVTRWCDFLDRQGIQPDGRSAYYVINCFAGEPGELPSTVNGDMTRHNTEMSYQFTMGAYFQQDVARRRVYEQRIQALFAAVADKDLNRTPRAFNWAFQASSQMVYFLQHAARN